MTEEVRGDVTYEGELRRRARRHHQRHLPRPAPPVTSGAGEPSHVPSHGLATAVTVTHVTISVT